MIEPGVESGSERIEVVGPKTLDTEALAEGHEVRVLERRRNGPVRAETFGLDTLHISIGTVVVEQQGDRDVVLGCRRQLRGREQEATVADQPEDLTIAGTYLSSYGLSHPGAECSGRTAGEEGSWMTKLEEEVRSKSHLGHVLHDDAVVGQHIPDE